MRPLLSKSHAGGRPSDAALQPALTARACTRTPSSRACRCAQSMRSWCCNSAALRPRTGLPRRRLKTFRTEPKSTPRGATPPPLPSLRRKKWDSRLPSWSGGQIGTARTDYNFDGFSVGYYCNATADKAAQLFGHTETTSLSVLCALEAIDCFKGVGVAGYSQGARQSDQW
jgi:hypothetical protein